MVAEDTGGLVGDALAGDQHALTRLVAALTPVVQARVARTLLARRAARGGGRNLRHEVEDLTQEIFLALFVGGGRVLRSWRAERGLSLESFVGLVSERHVVSFLRSGRRNPWREDLGMVDDLAAAAGGTGPEETAASREQLGLLLERLQSTLSPLGRQVFQLLFVQELTLPEAMAASGLSADAVYAWRSRLRRTARELLGELSGSTPEPRKKGGVSCDE
jgi:RNA polymerase sigma-70 factor (ECF subfamily)